MTNQTPAHRLYGEEQNALGLTITGAGFQCLDFTGKKGLKKRILDCHALIFLLRGSGTFQSRSHPDLSRVSEGHALLLFPGEWHAYGPGPGDTWDETWFLFKGPMAKLWQEARYIKPESPLHRLDLNGPALELLSLCRSIIKKTPAIPSSLPALFFNLLALVVQGETPVQQDPDNPITVITRQIREAPCDNWDFRKKAGEMHMSYSQFRQKFVLQNHLPPYRFLLAERMKTACALLASGEKPHKTAFAIGMKDPFHFSRLFKRIMGTAPRKFQGFVSSH